jgi:ribose transport system permease protein
MEESSMSNKVNLSKIYEKYGVFIILAIEFIVFSLISSNFLKIDNLLSVGRQVSFIGIAAVGATLLMMAGGIDISNGAMLALSGVICTHMMVAYGLPIAVAIIISLVIGFMFGAISGIAYAKFNVSPFIATLGMQTILKGIAYLITGAKPIRGFDESFKILGQGYIFNFFPLPLLIMVIVFVFGYWVLNRTFIGRYIYAIGGNKEAARLAGINTSKYSILVFATSGFFAAGAGVLMASRLGSGQPSIGTDFPMDVITGIVLGGVSINGGKGKISGVVAGVFIMGILSNGMIMAGLNDYWQWVVKGIVLIFAVAMSNIGFQNNK